MDDLQRELGRLETQLVETTPDSRSRFQLANLRVASPCKERWADMSGDDRVRVCNGCDRPVFNLSEMTRDQAEAVLATRGIKPCVRFYRRVDGTVMTTDCPTVPQRSRRLTVITAGTLLASSSAMAEPAPAPTEEIPTEIEPTTDNPTTDLDRGEWLMGDIAESEPSTKRAAVEWSTWARLGYGIASQPSTLAARTMRPLMPESSGIGEGALGADVSFGVARRDTVRLGVWAELRTVSEPVLGGELIVGGLPSLHGGGNRGIVLRAGGNAQVVTGALGVGYSAADSRLGFGHATGVRIVTSMTRSIDDARDWSVTVGVEFDPIGALGYIVHLASNR